MSCYNNGPEPYSGKGSYRPEFTIDPDSNRAFENNTGRYGRIIGGTFVPEVEAESATERHSHYHNGLRPGD
jgi:hypothetical protein